MKKILAILTPATALVLIACSGRAAPNAELSPPPTATPAPAPQAVATLVPTPRPDPASFPNGGADIVKSAFGSIVDFHIDFPPAAPLLESAWREASAEARRDGVDPTGLAPALVGDRDEAWAAFEASYVALVARAPAAQSASIRFAAIGGMTRSLNDCHTFFLPPPRSEALLELRTGSGSVGVGIELALTRPPYVREVAAGGPAQRAGVLLGDSVIAIDGRDVTFLGVDAIGDLLRGEPGSTVTLEVRRPGTGARQVFSLIRAFVRVPPVEARVLQEGVGYIRIRAFTSGTSVRQAVERAAAEFEAEGAKGWILDLRDNSGGESDLELDGRFIGEAVAERSLLRGGGTETKDGEGEPFPAKPIAVLTSPATASVSEIFASMLQDYGRARVFGTATAGCAGFVTLIELPDGSTLGVTIAHSLTPKTEKPLFRTGVIPDETVSQTPEDLAAGRDQVIDRAALWLRAPPPWAPSPPPETSGARASLAARRRAPDTSPPGSAACS